MATGGRIIMVIETIVSRINEKIDQLDREIDMIKEKSEKFPEHKLPLAVDWFRKADQLDTYRAILKLIKEAENDCTKEKK
jgi:hypothetical protein